ncbi:MAG: indolepyruvate ferredoxin oxidoreductase family protein [Ilumatobacteraceae bacterium]
MSDRWKTDPVVLHDPAAPHHRPPDAPTGPSGYRLDDRYRSDDGTVFLSGAQALARLPVEQLRADRAAGLRTAAYVTGYPGSPLAGYDRDADAVAALATADGLHLVHQPAINEELAATAVMGSQLTVTLDSCRYDGVLGVWYGKTPGLDRASDALRHAVFAGTSEYGGAIALVGEDPTAKSSTLPSSSDAALVGLHVPVLAPGDVQDAVDLGRHAVALSRASGLWTAIKVVESVADGTGTVELHPDRVVPVIPELQVDTPTGPVRFRPRPTGRLLTPYTLDIERELHGARLEMARRYGAANGLNAVTVRGPHDWIGLVAAGAAYGETREALRLLGLRSDDDLRDAGIRLLRLRLPIPLDAQVVRDFADGLAEVMVVEDKQPLLELRVMEALYALAERPTISGKRTPEGVALLPPTGSLTADVIAPHLRSRLVQRLAPERLAPPATPVSERRLIPLTVNRTPYFCSGCPHNTSTRAPEGALVGGGIGCHTMVMLMEQGPFGNVVGVTAMGNEGAQWFGMAPFVDEPHLIQNLGDGTLFHSGMLAVRAAVASGSNITYKVLYNGAVSMTGGQRPAGQLDVPALAKVFLAEGVRRVLVTTDDPSRYRGVALPVGVEVWSRERILEAQEALAAVPGTTVLVHDQRCAAELRRDRKRGRAAPPAWRLVIDPRVCEGCGDCGTASNCLSVQPIDTPFGRRTAIDQASCNLDASCLNGDCPSFLRVTPSRRSRRQRRTADRPGRPTVDVASLPDPAPVVDRDDCTVRLSGIGGTGVVTVSQILGTAAMLDGLTVRGLDQTGLSQKAGPVVSDVRLTRGAPRASNRASAGSVDALLAFDVLVAASDTHLAGASPDRTIVMASTSTVGTGSMVGHPERSFPHAEAITRLTSCSRSISTTDAIARTTDVLGDAAMANVYLLGVAVQRGVVPVSPAAVEEAISLNGVAVEKNLTAFRAGRADAVAPPSSADDGRAPAPEPLDTLVDRLADDLRAYQDRRYAQRFRDVVARAAATGDDALARAVAVHLHQLMAYKDEYEVARLLLSPSSRDAAEAVGGPGAKVQWNLHPPLLRSLGLRRKLRLGSWARPLLVVLRAGRRVRGTPLDVFGVASLRRLERAMVPEYVAAVDRVVASYSPERAAEAVAIASLPDQVRGYEHLKRTRAEAYRAELAARLAAYG